MKASHEPSQARELFLRQLRLESPRTLREDREHHFVNFENTLSLVVGERADDGNFAFFEGLQKSVLGLNRGTAPAAGAVQFDNDVRAFFHLDVVHTVFQRMERVEASRATPAQFLGGIENNLWKNLQEVVSHSLHPRRAFPPCILPLKNVSRVGRVHYLAFPNKSSNVF